MKSEFPPTPEPSAETAPRIASLPPGTVEVDAESMELKQLPTPAEAGVTVTEPAHTPGAPYIRQAATVRVRETAPYGEGADGIIAILPARNVTVPERRPVGAPKRHTRRTPGTAE